MIGTGKNIVECENLVKIYKTKDIEVLALQGLDLTVEEGEQMAIIGNSGSGKSTLLNMIGGLDRPSAGRLLVDGKDIFKLNDEQLAEYKQETVGFVWQNNARNLKPYLTAMQNVQLPMSLAAVKSSRERALELLTMVGLDNRRNSRLDQLSGGEQQRVAIAIALSNHPRLLLADEPTGAVDSRTAAGILDVFRVLNRELGVTIIIVTHDRQLSMKVNRVVSIRDGRTSSEFLHRLHYAEQMNNLDPMAMRTKLDESHIEVAVVDKAGRIQIPREGLDTLGIKGKGNVRVEIEGNRVVLVPLRKEE